MRALIVLDAGPTAAAAMERISERLHITQQLPPRLALVEGEAADLQRARTLVGVTAVCTQRIDDVVFKQLNEAERLFAEAWTLSLKPKGARRGDGLPWDAAGFQPPDRIDN